MEDWRRTSTSGMEVSSSSNELYWAAMAGAAYNSMHTPTHTRTLPVRAMQVYTGWFEKNTRVGCSR
jgi:hypothetical protein